MREKLLLALLCCAQLGCASSEKITLSAGPDQQAIVRDGSPALVSQKKNLVMLRANGRLVPSGSRPAFTLVVRNQGSKPETLLEAGVTANQTVGSKLIAVRVYRYDELLQEEQTRQAWATFGTAISAAGRSMSAANAGYTNTPVPSTPMAQAAQLMEPTQRQPTTHCGPRSRSRRQMRKPQMTSLC